MGLFSSDPLEDNLKRQYVDIFIEIGMSSSEAETTISELIKKAKEEMITNGEDKIPVDMAERLISDPRVIKQYQKRKNDGVTDTDIRWWYGMTSLERSLLFQIDNFHMMTMVCTLLKEGKNMGEAMDYVQKFHPIFGDSDDTSKQSGEDRPLHAELKNRINMYIEKRFNNNPEEYKSDMEKSTSFNALIRKEIKAGNL